MNMSGAKMSPRYQKFHLDLIWVAHKGRLWQSLIEKLWAFRVPGLWEFCVQKWLQRVGIWRPRGAPSPVGLCSSATSLRTSLIIWSRLDLPRGSFCKRSPASQFLFVWYLIFFLRTLRLHIFISELWGQTNSCKHLVLESSLCRNIQQPFVAVVCLLRRVRSLAE